MPKRQSRTIIGPSIALKNRTFALRILKNPTYRQRMFYAIKELWGNGEPFPINSILDQVHLDAQLNQHELGPRHKQYVDQAIHEAIQTGYITSNQGFITVSNDTKTIFGELETVVERQVQHSRYPEITVFCHYFGQKVKPPARRTNADLQFENSSLLKTKLELEDVVRTLRAALSLFRNPPPSPQQFPTRTHSLLDATTSFAAENSGTSSVAGPSTPPRTKSLQKHPSFAIGGLPPTPDSNPRAPRRSPSTSLQPGVGFILDAMDVDPDNGVTFEPSRTENSCQTELSDAELQNQALREQVKSLNGDVRRLKGDFDKKVQEYDTLNSKCIKQQTELTALVQDRETHRLGMELLKSKLVHRQDPSTGAEIVTEAHNELEEASVVYSLLAERVDERQAELETAKAELTAMNSSRAMLLNLAAIMETSENRMAA